MLFRSTYDTAPTKDSVWKVIHSIQGGCPAKNQAGNMGDSASAVDPFTYQFQIPDDVPTGNATIAWTWLNRIGNREYYMNCAPISITGESGDESSFDALPDMIVANIPAITSCSTTNLDGKDYRFPNPGASVDNFNMTELVDLNGDCGAKVAGGSGSSGGAGTTSAAPVQAPTTSASAAAPTLPGGVFITVPVGGASSSAAAAQPTQATPATQATPTTLASVSKAPTTAAAASPTATTSSGSTGSSGSGSSTSGAQTAGAACSPEGLWNCVGGTSYQQCGSGFWSPVMQLAAGMECTPGQSSTLSMKAINGKLRSRLARFQS